MTDKRYIEIKDDLRELRELLVKLEKITEEQNGLRGREPSVLGYFPNNPNYVEMQSYQKGKNDERERILKIVDKFIEEHEIPDDDGEPSIGFNYDDIVKLLNDLKYKSKISGEVKE